MKITCKNIVIAMGLMVFLASCNTIEQASTHGLHSGFYKMKTENKHAQPVYLDVINEQIEVYQSIKQQPDTKKLMTISFNKTDSVGLHPLVFKKRSLDIDITSILLKYRPSVYGLPSQLTTDLNIALYAGWRNDTYQITSKKDPLGKRYYKINNRGYDFGVFAGPGTTLLSPFTTLNRRSDEYNALIIQAGFAGFIELSMASFGFAVGYDYLPGKDRKIWIYHHKPWVGLIIGIALN